ncbi:pentatricopeptide repeat-containing protein At2g37230 isoform X3 [Amborella trichopoda]|uniref:pentatricopeptide repeat-containing protein At2g37230 isoform X3 n=1 Tax=Amborella trichopoda TaxID=13333 RepID=UPI0005D40247|nr:pentatricopeptide repeat-containing protein At2g37230 isoform X3 [Amborella trichopoda]|eukprot:XP_011624278.1 pentatricopeptide repeat-containing protein At2g37230 isoform X3 [Amborella trichopoda]
MASISSSTTQSSIKILRQKTSPWRSSFFHHPLRAFFTNPPAKSSENETPPIDGEPISNQSHEFYGEPDQSSRSSSERVQESVKIFNKMKELGIDPTVRSYNNFFSVILKRGRTFMAKRYFNAMIRNGVSPNIYTYNILIWGFCLSTKMATANRFFSDMRERGISPDIITYNTMISGCCRVGDMENALKSFNELNEKGMAPDEITYTHLIKGFVGAGRIEEALDFFREMGGLKLKSNALIYQALVLGLYENGKMDDAQTLLKEMMKRNFRPSDPSIFLTVMKAQCDVGNLDEAMDILKGMKNLRISPESAHYGVLIEGHCNKGLHDKAGKLLDEVMEDGILLNPGGSPLEPSVYNPIIRYLCEIGHTQKAELFFRQLMKLGVQDPLSFNNLIAGHSRERMPEHGFELLKIMARRGIPSDSNAYSSLVESYLKICEPADAKTALDSMIESGHLPSPSLFRSVMDSLFSDGRVQTASRVMYTMLDKDVLENLDLVAKILEALLLRGHVEEALGRIDLMLRKGCYPDFNHLLTTLCKKEKTIAALKLLDYCLERDCNVNFSSYDLVLDALISAGKTLNAYSILCKITEKGGMKKPTSFESLIKTLSEEGNTKQADILSRLVAQKTSGARKGQKVAMST